MNKTVFLSIGSNIASRIFYINSAIKLLRNHGRILDTSFLYETKPLYNLDQNKFYNGVLKFETNLDPSSLLNACKEIEKKLGRKESNIYKGPRVIDLDILFYENSIIETENLKIPHPLIQERDFVLKPIIDIDPNFTHPILNKTIINLYIENQKNISKLSFPSKIFAYGKNNISEKLLDFKNKCYSMGIINMTPDSFHHSYLKNQSDIKQTYNIILNEIKEKKNYFDIFDIGGESTRPNSKQISLEEEKSRLYPLLELISKDLSMSDITISIDTRRNELIDDIINNNFPIDFVNDVSSGRFSNNKLLKSSANHLLPIILMHSRGEPNNMDSLTTYNDLINEIIQEIQNSIKQAILLGIPKWNIIIDPGFGFAKNNEQNFEIVKQMDKLKKLGYPLLVGFSNKRFVKNFFGEKYLNEGNSALAGICVQKGADIIRIHDYNISKCIRFASKIYRETN